MMASLMAGKVASADAKGQCQAALHASLTRHLLAELSGVLEPWVTHTA